MKEERRNETVIQTYSIPIQGGSFYYKEAYQIALQNITVITHASNNFSNHSSSNILREV